MGRPWCAGALSTRTNTRCCSSPIPWTKLSTTSARGSKNTIWISTPSYRLPDPQPLTNCLFPVVYGVDQRLLHSLRYGVYNLGPDPIPAREHTGAMEKTGTVKLDGISLLDSPSLPSPC